MSKLFNVSCTNCYFKFTGCTKYEPAFDQAEECDDFQL